MKLISLILCFLLQSGFAFSKESCLDNFEGKKDREILINVFPEPVYISSEYEFVSMNSSFAPFAKRSPEGEVKGVVHIGKVEQLSNEEHSVAIEIKESISTFSFDGKDFYFSVKSLNDRKLYQVIVKDAFDYIVVLDDEEYFWKRYFRALVCDWKGAAFTIQK